MHSLHRLSPAQLLYSCTTHFVVACPFKTHKTCKAERNFGTSMPAGSWRQADRLDRERYQHFSASCGPTLERAKNSGEKRRTARKPERPPERAAQNAPPIPTCAAGSAPVVRPRQPQDTLYALLGVECTASAAEVRRAYRRLLITAHPDKGGSRLRFEQLQAAYAVLSDPAERLIYDEKLERSLGGSRSSSMASPGRTADQPAAEAAMACGRLQRSTAGVTAVVHGQSQGTPQQQQQQQQPSRRSRQPSEWARQLTAATAAIESARAGQEPGAAAALAGAHLDRAALYRAAGQLHHALFDAEEALRVQPELEGASAMAAQLATAIAAADQAGRAGKLQESDCSSSSSDDHESNVL